MQKVATIFDPRRSINRTIVATTRQRVSPQHCKTIKRNVVAATPGGTTTAVSNDNMEESRMLILKSSLEKVHDFGWTEDAIVAGVVSLEYPLSMMGLVSPFDVVKYFMDDCNHRLKQDLEQKVVLHSHTSSHESVAQRIACALQMRLEYVIPLVNSNRWHEGMAIGAMPPNNTSVTALQLDEMITTVCKYAFRGDNEDNRASLPFGPMERATIGAIYIATELHLLTDKSDNFEDTWKFLNQRVGELELVAKSTSLQYILKGDAAVATMAVAASLGGAVLSLAKPTARGIVSMTSSTIVPQLASFLQPQSSSPLPFTNTNVGEGTRPSDYDDFPPFPSEKDAAIKTNGITSASTDTK